MAAKTGLKPDLASWVGVVAHPFFAVSNETGKFDIKGLPPGSYTLEAVHETYGRQTAKVTVGDKQEQTVSFSFKADSK